MTHTDRTYKFKLRRYSIYFYLSWTYFLVNETVFLVYKLHLWTKKVHILVRENRLLRLRWYREFLRNSFRALTFNPVIPPFCSRERTVLCGSHRPRLCVQRSIQPHSSFLSPPFPSAVTSWVQGDSPVRPLKWIFPVTPSLAPQDVLCDSPYSKAVHFIFPVTTTF